MKKYIYFGLPLLLFCTIYGFNYYSNKNAVLSQDYVQYTALKTLSAEQFQSYIDMSENIPVFAIIYTSWCGFCKPVIQYLEAFQSENMFNFPILTISTDIHGDKAEYFVHNNLKHLNHNYIIHQPEEYAQFSEQLRAMGLDFTGGIFSNGTRKNGVPYLMAFYKKKPIFHHAGKLSSDRLKEELEKIADIAK